MSSGHVSDIVNPPLMTRYGHRLCAAAFQIMKEQSTYRRDVRGGGSFDHLVGTHEQRGRNHHAERFRGLEIDRQFDLSGLLHRQVTGFLAAKNSARIDAGLTKSIGSVRPIGHQGAGFRNEASFRKDGGDRAADRKYDDAVMLLKYEWVSRRNEPTDVRRGDARGCSLDVRQAGYMEDDQGYTKYARRGLCFLGFARRIGIGGIDDEGDCRPRRQELMQHLQPLCGQCVPQRGHAGNVAAGTVQVRDKARSDRVAPDPENDRN